jgi:hypothetical protein
VLHLLRPREWAERNGAHEGATIDLSLRELNIEGSARVTSVRAAPALGAGSRCPVTGTIRRSGVQVIVVEFEQGAPMELTANHRVFSATRNGWVAAGELREGEALQAREGTVRVRAVRGSERGLTSVFNLEVYARHEFFVGEELVRAHNGYAWAQEGYIYRGVSANHPAIDLARQGIVRPANSSGSISAASHNLGGVSSRSPFTSWTHSPDIARYHALKEGPGGVIVRVPIGELPPSASWIWEFSEDLYGELEVLLLGERRGVEVFLP